jgi:hypothetical protein
MEWVDSLLRSAGAVGADTFTALGGLAGAVAVIVVAFRKRRDVDVIEMGRRIESLEDRVELLEGELETTRVELVAAESHRFVLRRTLAQHGINDPTIEAS